MRIALRVAEKSFSRIPRTKYTLSAREFNLKLGEQTKIMGILNLTPDSFSGDGLLAKKNDVKRNVDFAQGLISQGADIIDIGGESTRPGSLQISEKEEAARIIPTVTVLSKRIKVPISVDTYKEAVANKALDAGASIVNNIMGTKVTKPFLRHVKNYHAAIVLMHIRGTPGTMQKRIFYKDLVGEILGELRMAVEKCLEAGIKATRIIVDPGIGFGKTAAHNLEIIERLCEFRSLDKPILIGTSRKSFIGKILNNGMSDRLIGTTATVCASILRGTHIVRVHDVKEIKEAALMSDAIINVN